MGVKLLPIVVYTHTDMKDVWIPFFGQLKKYMPDNEVYVCVNRDDEMLSDYNRVIYDETKSYTEKLAESLEQINEEIFLFTHEDMILFDKPNYEYLEKYYSYVKDRKVDSIKLIYAGDGGIKAECDETLVLNDFSKFSIQPTIIRKDILLQIASNVGKLNIWEFENAIVGSGMDFMARRGNEKKRGLYHYDSFVYPYVSTAINKGKWNLNEYTEELNPIFEEYNINPFERGMS
jgi:hypothetical protein